MVQKPAEVGRWLASTPEVPKLLLTTGPGSLLSPEIEQWSRDTIAGLEVESIGEAIASWLGQIGL